MRILIPFLRRLCPRPRRTLLLGGGAPSASAQALAPPPGPPSQSASALPSVAPPLCPRDDPSSTLGLPFSQYGSNLCEGPGSLDLSSLISTVLGPLPAPQAVAEGEENCVSVGMEVLPPESPRFVGMVCYHRSPGTPSADPPRAAPVVPATPDHAVLEQVTVFPDTPVAGAKTRPSRRFRTPPPPPSRHSARLARARAGAEVVEPTVAALAERRAAARDVGSGTTRSKPPPSTPPPSPPSGSRFSVLDSVPLEHLA